MPLDLSDRALMLRYRAGDTAAFEVLYGRHRGPLYRFLLRRTGEAALAEDLFQETWARVIRHREKYRPTAKFSTYLYTVAGNCVTDAHRTRQRRPQLVAVDGDAVEPAGDSRDEPDAGAEAAEAADRLRAAIDGLPEEQRTAFLLKAEAGLGLNDIAKITGCGRETVKSRLRYAVGKLRAAILTAQTVAMTGTGHD